MYYLLWIAVQKLKRVANMVANQNQNRDSEPSRSYFSSNQSTEPFEGHKRKEKTEIQMIKSSFWKEQNIIFLLGPFPPMEWYLLNVRVGINNFTFISKSENQTYESGRLIPHPNYTFTYFTPPEFRNDIGLIKVKN